MLPYPSDKPSDVARQPGAIAGVAQEPVAIHSTSLGRASRRVDVDRRDVLVEPGRGGSQSLDLFSLGIESEDLGLARLAPFGHRVDVALRRLLGGGPEAQLGIDLDRRAAFLRIEADELAD